MSVPFQPDTYFTRDDEVSALLRAFDWSASPLGQPHSWPHSLRNAINLILASQFPMFILWGEGLRYLYNDAYRAILGERHPAAIGQPFDSVWPELAESDIAGIVKSALLGQSGFFENMPATLMRKGYPEQTWFTFSYSPLTDDTGHFAGVFCACTETTALVELERRQAFTLEMADHLRGIGGTQTLLQRASDLLGRHLRASRVVFADIDEAADSFFCHSGYADESSNSPEGVFALSGLDAGVLADLKRGLTAIFNPPLTAPNGGAGHEGLGAGAVDCGASIAVPLRRSGVLIGALLVHFHQARSWHAIDVSAVEDIAERSWDAFERARIQDGHLRAEQELRDSEDHYRHTVEFNPHAQWTALPDGALDRVSERWHKWTGTSGLGGSWGDAIHPADLQRSIDTWTRSLATGEAYDIDHRVRMLDGSFHWMRSRAYSQRDAAGAIVKWYGTTQDVDDFKQVLEELSKREQEFRTLAEAIPNHAWVAEPNGNIIWFNQRVYEYTGATSRDLIGSGWASVIHADDVAHTLVSWSQALAHGTPYQTEFRLRSHSTGEYRWFIARALPVQDESKQIKRWIGTNTDVHEQKISSAQLSRLNATLEEEVARRTADRDRVWRNSPDLLAVLDSAGIFRDVNPAWTAILGYEPAELVGRYFHEFIDPADIGASNDALLSASTDSLPNFENRYRDRAGNEHWILWTAAPDAGAVYAIGKDITSEKRQLEALRLSEEALRQAQKMESIGKLTGGVAHDFNNVLQIVRGNLHLLEPAVVSNRQAQDRLGRAHAAVERGAKLSSQLLAFARRQPLKPVVVNLGQLVRNTDDLLRRALGETIEVETVLGGGLWNTVVDPSQMENVILNLAINARDAMRGIGRLTLEIGNATLDDLYSRNNDRIPPGHYVLLAVSDTGSGMTAEVIEKAFEPFFTTKPEGEGTGLGLSMAYGFVKQSNGHIKIYSEAGCGTTIKIYLPRSSELETAPQEVQKGPITGGSETVLVVEDDLMVQTTVVETLIELGYRVLKASNAQAALTILRSGMAVDLLFTDVVMPGVLRSPELAREARKILPGIAVLFTSGYTQNAIVHDGQLDAGVELLSKPYRRDEMARMIRQVLDSRKPVTVALPLAQPPPVRMPEPIAEAPPGHVLVVEDNAELLDMIGALMSILGRPHSTAESAEAALVVLAEGKFFNVLLTDITLPGMSGVDLARHVSRQHPHMRIVLTSGYAAGSVETLDFPATFLPKPYTIDELEKTLDNLDSPLGRHPASEAPSLA